MPRTVKRLRYRNDRRGAVIRRLGVGMGGIEMDLGIRTDEVKGEWRGKIDG